MPRRQIRLAIETAARALTDAAAELATDEANEPAPSGPDLGSYHRLARDEPDAIEIERVLWNWGALPNDAEIGLTRGCWLYIRIGDEMRSLPPMAWLQLARTAPGRRGRNGV